MKDPQPLLDDGATELELLLLRAGDAEGPSPAARRAAAASLGLGMTAITASASALGAPSLTPAAKVLAVKWWIVGALASMGAGVAIVAGMPDEAASIVPTTIASSSRGALAEPPRPQAVPTPHGTSPAAPSAVTPDRPQVAMPRALPSASTGIQAQISLIDRARSAAASGQPGATLAALDDYQRRFPGGVLQQEAAMLRIEAMLARGDKATAKRLGQRFLEQYPRSALAARVKSLLEE